jgi:hypothetical protein
MLESLILYAAAKVGANVVTVDMQDLMELTADIFNSKGAGTDQSFSGFSQPNQPHHFLVLSTDNVVGWGAIGGISLSHP